MLRYLFPFIDPDVKSWPVEARLLRWLTLLWLLLGLAMLFSASYAISDADFGDGLYYVKRQFIWIWVGLIALNFITARPIKYILNLAGIGLLVILAMIFITLIPGMGETVNGATRWLKIGPVVIQPSELIKPFLVLQSAKVFGYWHRLSVGQRLGWIGIFALVLACILLQPNLSTTALCGMAIWLIALASGLPFSYLGSTALLGITTAVVSISLREYQRKRIMSFLDPWADAKNDGYQLVQSLLAIGSGGTWGSGYGLSQQKLHYLPFPDTDFIFAVFSEEFGLVGSILLLLMLMIYATLALRVALLCKHRVKRLVAIGVMVVLVGQCLLHVGVATGSLPTTGLPLPLFSYGGSSSVASIVLASLLIRVAREEPEGSHAPEKKSKLSAA